MSNVGYTPGAGKTIATDTVSTVDYQRVKMVIGSTGKVSDMRPATPGASLASTVAATIASSSGILLGISFWSTASGSCGVQIRDSTSSSTGTVLWGVFLWSTTASGILPRFANEWFGPQGIKLASGLRIVRSGAKSSVTLHYVSPTPA